MLFRKDLRLYDNQALHAACLNHHVLPVFIWPEESAEFSMGGASKWWLHYSLKGLQNQLAANKQQLIFLKQTPEQSLDSILTTLCQLNQCEHVFWNRRYEPHHIQQDTKLKATLKDQGIDVHSFNNNLLSEPWQHVNKQGTPFKVFTPYWRHCKNAFLSSSPISSPLPMPKFQVVSDWKTPDHCQLDDFNLLPSKPDWAQGFHQYWQPGEEHAQNKWNQFLSHNIENYDQTRNFPNIDGTSKLSPHLAFGEISTRQIWHDIQHQKNHLTISQSDAIDCYLSEIGWREFSYYQLFHFPELPHKNFNSRFNQFKWNNNETDLSAWHKGMTGYPLIDAGLRELWQTGYMHNRVRMVVASFLCKDLLIDWQSGATWFWDTLLDADLASNSASWQWCAGCGADAAPFFRIFNPVTQSEKFDPEGNYIKRWVPELSKLPSKWIHKPWEAPTDVLQSANIMLGKHYPVPIVDHKSARLEALERYKHLKNTAI